MQIIILLTLFLNRAVEEELAVGAEYCSDMADLLQKSDFVMVVVNLTPKTHSLIGREQLQLMKPTATLINISRGTSTKFSTYT